MSVLILRKRENPPTWEKLAAQFSTSRPAHCPRCGSKRLTALYGSAHCFDCGHNWTYLDLLGLTGRCGDD